jgi:hypothetical protein
MGGLLFGFESKGDGWMGIQDMSHVIGKSKAELLAMARTHQEGKKAFSTPGETGLHPVKQEPLISPSRVK